MHCAPRAEEAAPAFSATAATAARVRAARGRISHAHAARRCSRRRRRGLGAAGRPWKARSADPIAGPSEASCGGRASSAPPPQAPPLAPPCAARWEAHSASALRPAPGESRGAGAAQRRLAYPEASLPGNFHSMEDGRSVREQDAYLGLLSHICTQSLSAAFGRRSLIHVLILLYKHI
ncbi:unnamed protein product [Rangifer tarandus platyrhynchus]|uniref:Uncharacterized protein n=2 Tax=Rangifer tarandus platyrhynchus TaxID=3082113 RepID=A0ABN8YJT5_RANTA|nr:unnamed protein product [Rangifer tarandus platyrhynchus]CAI9697215.1 unnamed protein product [Rangifer tarandus platyrhynchus]